MAVDNRGVLGPGVLDPCGAASDDGRGRIARDQREAVPAVFAFVCVSRKYNTYDSFISEQICGGGCCR